MNVIKHGSKEVIAQVRHGVYNLKCDSCGCEVEIYGDELFSIMDLSPLFDDSKKKDGRCYIVRCPECYHQINIKVEK